MEYQINDFNFAITSVVVAHRIPFDQKSYYNCLDGRKYYGLVCAITGKLVFNFYDKKQLELNAGEVVLLKPSDRYIVTAPTGCEHYAINFEIPDKTMEGDISKKFLLSKDDFIIRQGTFANLNKETFENICSIWQKKEFGYRVKATVLANKLLFNFIKSLVSYEQGDGYNKIKPAIKMLEEKWNAQLSLKDLASVCSLSVSHFRHVFFKTLKIPPMEYRDSLRILYAKDYLMSERYTIKEIASLCGFLDVNYFNRFFKKHVGTTPTKYVNR